VAVSGLARVIGTATNQKLRAIDSFEADFFSVDDKHLLDQDRVLKADLDPGS